MYFKIATCASVSISLILTLFHPLKSIDSTNPADDQIIAAVSTQPDVFMDTDFIPEGRVAVKNGLISAPANSENIFSLRMHEVPMKSINEVSESFSKKFYAKIQDEGDGAFRALFHIPNKTSPRNYKFSVGEGFELFSLEDGGVAVRDLDGNLAGTFAAPWAVDSLGLPVKTDYVIDGNVITQRVHADPSSNFPVVADPFWIPALMVMAHVTRHAALQAAKRGVSQAMVKQVVQNGVKTAGNNGTTIYTQGRGSSMIRVIVDNKTGNIVTVTKG